MSNTAYKIATLGQQVDRLATSGIVSNEALIVDMFSGHVQCVDMRFD